MSVWKDRVSQGVDDIKHKCIDSQTKSFNGKANRVKTKSERLGTKIDAHEGKYRKKLLKNLLNFDANAGMEYIQLSLERAQHDNEIPETMFDVANETYSRHLMINMCGSLLSKPSSQISKSDIEQAIGVGVACYMLDPTFRNNVNQFVDNSISHIIKKSSDNAVPGSDWAQATESVKKQKGKRLPLTSKNAAMLYIGLSKSAYEEMRVPNANVTDIKERYQKNVDSLLNLVDKDGISSEDFNKSIRITYGQLCREDPSLEYIFSETAYSNVKREKGQFQSNEVLNRTFWQGEYSQIVKDEKGNIKRDFEGKPIREPYTGRFSLRMPMKPHDRIKPMEDHLSRGFNLCKTDKDLKKVFYEPLDEEVWRNRGDGKKYSVVKDWRNRADRFMQMAMDDCCTDKERDIVEKEWMDETQIQLQNWCDNHSEYDFEHIVDIFTSDDFNDSQKDSSNNQQSDKVNMTDFNDMSFEEIKKRHDKLKKVYVPGDNVFSRIDEHSK